MSDIVICHVTKEEAMTLRHSDRHCMLLKDYCGISVLKARCHQWDCMEILSEQIVRKVGEKISLQVKYIDGVSSNEDSGNEEEEEEEPGESHHQHNHCHQCDHHHHYHHHHHHHHHHDQ